MTDLSKMPKGSKPAANAKAELIFKMAEKLDNAAREVSFRAGRIAAGLPVDRMELGDYFTTLHESTKALAKEIGLLRKGILK